MDVNHLGMLIMGPVDVDISNLHFIGCNNTSKVCSASKVDNSIFGEHSASRNGGLFRKRGCVGKLKINPRGRLQLVTYYPQIGDLLKIKTCTVLIFLCFSLHSPCMARISSYRAGIFRFY